MVAFLYRIPCGIPGDVNRAWGAHIEAASVTPVGTTGAPTTYGVPVVVDATGGNVGNLRTVTTGDTAIYGILVRPFPSQSLPTVANGAYSDNFGAGVPPPKGSVDVLRRGYMTVLLAGTTPAVKNAPVYVWLAAPTGAHVTGGFEAAAGTGGQTLAIPATFMGAADANGNVEIAYNL